jgi:hypothetical protein
MERWVFVVKKAGVEFKFRLRISEENGQYTSQKTLVTSLLTGYSVQVRMAATE